MLAFVGFCTCWVGWIRIKKTKPLNIVFDLDNTLIMSLEKRKYSQMKISNKPQIYLTNRVVWVRPWVRFVLYILNKFCNLYLFTKAEKPYADIILEQVGIGDYFISRKYNIDCINVFSDNKDIGKFSPSYKKIIGYNTKLKRLELFDSTDPTVVTLRSKIYSEIKTHQSKLAKFIKRTILVDNKITNKLPGQNFYHIDYYQFGMVWDISMLKLLGWIGWIRLINLTNL